MGEKKIVAKVVFDTNIWVSVVLGNSLAKDLLPLIRTGQVQVFVSDELSSELARVLIYPRIKRVLEKADVEPNAALSSVLELVTKIESSNKEKTPTVADEIKDDPDDNKVLECALISRAKFIVSGDKHLLELKEIEGIKILRAKEFVQIMKETN